MDADHIRLETVDRFLAPSDFFTIDVADTIGKPAPAEAVAAFARRHPELTGTVVIPGVPTPVRLDASERALIAGKYLLAGEDAATLEPFIALLAYARSVSDGLRRKACIDAFRVIEDEDLVSRYRRKMSSSLF